MDQPCEPKTISLTNRLKRTAAELDPNTTYLVGVAIMHETSTPQKLLVLKRAADDDTFPNFWAVPGGHVDPGETIEDAIKRETFEETGLEITGIEGEFAELRWLSRNGKGNVQLSFLATVPAFTEVKLNPEEHSTWMWLEEEHISKYPCSEGMAKVFRDAFKYVESSRVKAASGEE